MSLFFFSVERANAKDNEARSSHHDKVNARANVATSLRFVGKLFFLLLSQHRTNSHCLLRTGEVRGAKKSKFSYEQKQLIGMTFKSIFYLRFSHVLFFSSL